MATISSTLALAANVTAFDCTELWTLDSKSGTYYCPYVYATAELQQRCPHLLTGHHPRDKLEHFLSPKVSVCLLMLIHSLLLTSFFLHLTSVVRVREELS